MRPNWISTAKQIAPHTIICWFNKFKEKEKKLANIKKLENTGIYIYQDFSKDTMEFRKTLWEEILEYRRPA